MAYDLVEAVLISGASLPSPGIALIKLQSAAQDENAGIKDFANWPTIPQLYVKGEFVGGCDIMKEMYQDGELQKLFDGVAGSAA